MVDTKRNSEAVFHRPLLCAAFVVVALSSVACDKYQPTKHIEGTYRPSQCVTLQGIIPGGWLSSHNTIHPTICQPMRVSEIGVYTYGSGWSVPGFQAEVGRLEFADAGVLFDLSQLRQTGTLDYRDRNATLGEWTRNNPVKTAMLVLTGLVVAVAIPVGVVAWGSLRRRERERLEAEAAARQERLKAEEAARKAEEAARLEHHKEMQRGYRQEMIILGEQSLDLFESIPQHLTHAEAHLDQSEVDFAEGCFLPFWESIEKAAQNLGRFNENVCQINDNSSRYTSLIKKYEAVPPVFPLSHESVAKLAVATSTAKRLKLLVRKAHKNADFTKIYLLQKNNQILIAGLGNLAQALDQMTWRIRTSIDILASSVDAMNLTQRESLLAIHSRMGEIAETSSRHHEEKVAMTTQHHEYLSKEASAKAGREKKVVEMLDNIQRGRKPSAWEA